MPFLRIGTVSLLAVADSTMRSTLPFGTTVRPIVDSDTRNTRYASVWLILSGAITVTFLPVETMRGSRMKFLHVKPITHVMRSLSSVSGLNVTATGPTFFLQLYSDSSSPATGGFFSPPPGGGIGPGCASAEPAMPTRATKLMLVVFMIHRMWYL